MSIISWQNFPCQSSPLNLLTGSLLWVFPLPLESMVVRQFTELCLNYIPRLCLVIQMFTIIIKGSFLISKPCDLKVVPNIPRFWPGKRTFYRYFACDSLIWLFEMLIVTMIANTLALHLHSLPSSLNHANFGRHLQLMISVLATSLLFRGHLIFCFLPIWNQILIRNKFVILSITKASLISSGEIRPRYLLGFVWFDLKALLFTALLVGSCH